jgi:hypothetical protein
VKGTRGELLDRLAEAIESVTTAHPLRVAVDGAAGAGARMAADRPDTLLERADRQEQQARRDATQGRHYHVRGALMPGRLPGECQQRHGLAG